MCVSLRCTLKWSVSSFILPVRMATWTSTEPVSPRLFAYSVMMADLLSLFTNSSYTLFLFSTADYNIAFISFIEL